jgi:signal transduction histidine kinase
MSPAHRSIGSRSMRHVFGGAFLLTVAVLFTDPSDGVAGSGERERTTNVVLLYAESRMVPGIVALDGGIRARRETLPGPVFFYTEHLDSSQFVDEAPQAALQELLRRKCGGRRLDVIVAVGSRALMVALDNRPDLFRGVPVVFVAERRPAVTNLQLAADVTGLWLEANWSGTLEAALRLQPETQRVAVVSGAASMDQAWLAMARTQLATYRDRVEVTFLTDLSFDEVRQRVATLPDRTILFMGGFLRDVKGRDFSSPDVASRLAAVASVPTYGPADTFVGTGIVGGHVMDFHAAGMRSGELALRVLRGERGLPTEPAPSRYIFDWRQLQRWGLDEKRLPPGSVVRFRPLSAWDLYRWYIVGGVTVLAVQSALIAGLLVQRVKRRRAQRELAERLRFETLLSELSARFITLPADQVGRQIEAGLARIVEHLGLDRATLAELQVQREVAQVTHSARAKGIEPIPSAVKLSSFPWMLSRVLAGQVVRFSRREDLPDEGATDRPALAQLGTRSLAAIPLTVGGAVVGVLVFSTIRTEREWPDQLVPRLRLLGEVFGNALARQRAASAVRESEELRSAVFASLDAHVAAIDRHGVVIAVNQPWRQFAGDHGADLAAVSVGANYVELCEQAASRGDPVARWAVEAIRSVLAGEGGPAPREYMCRLPSEERWFSMAVAPFRRPEGGAVISHVDVTRRRQAEDEARRQREELAHALRVATLGELAASLTHEINQPLAAVLTNANAARRLLDGNQAERGEVPEVLADIAGDAKRASQIIRRLRALFRKESPAPRALDVNELVQDAVSLLRHDVERRRIAVCLALATDLPPALGDSVQLQQVVLNLLVNSCDAIDAAGDGPRQITIATGCSGPALLALSVRDTGIGVKDIELQRIFERFVTSKPDGLGMGLAISHSIVEAHGGRIWATANADCGLTVHVELPAEEGRPG